MQTATGYPDTPDFSDYSMITLLDLNGDSGSTSSRRSSPRAPRAGDHVPRARWTRRPRRGPRCRSTRDRSSACTRQQASDFDGSGRVQVLVGESNFGGWASAPTPTHRSTSTGSSATRPRPAPGSGRSSTRRHARGCASADLDGDGDFDLAGHEENSDRALRPAHGPVDWWENTTQATARPGCRSTTTPPASDPGRRGSVSTLVGSSRHLGERPRHVRLPVAAVHARRAPAARRSPARSRLHLRRRRSPTSSRPLRFRVTAMNPAGPATAVSAVSGADPARSVDVAGLRVLAPAVHLRDRGVRGLRVALHRRRRPQRRRP